MTAVQVLFPSDVFAALRQSPEEVSRDMRVASAIRWYAQGRVSQGKAAELAGLSRAEFIDEVSSVGVTVCQETLEDLDTELERG